MQLQQQSELLLFVPAGAAAEGPCPVHTQGAYWVVNSPVIHLPKSGERAAVFFHNSAALPKCVIGPAPAALAPGLGHETSRADIMFIRIAIDVARACCAVLIGFASVNSNGRLISFGNNVIERSRELVTSV